MGFVKPKKIFKISWAEGSNYPGLLVRAGSLSTGEMLEIAGLAKFASDGGDVVAEQVSKLFTTFAMALVDWNLEEEFIDGGHHAATRAVPATIEGMYSQDFDFMLEVIMRWVASITNVAPELGKASTSGEQSLEESMPMDVQ